MITAILGKPGAGKGLKMTQLLGRFCGAGLLVASNIESAPGFPWPDQYLRLDDPHNQYPVFDVSNEPREGYKRSANGRQYYRAFWDFLGPGNWKILIDELDNYFDSMDFANIPPEGRIYWKQHRKFKHDVFYTVQSLENLFNRIRRQTQLAILCENTERGHPWFRWLPRSLSRFNHYVYADMDLTTLVDQGHMSYREASEVFGWYYTDQILSGVSHGSKGGGRVAIT